MLLEAPEVFAKSRKSGDLEDAMPDHLIAPDQVAAALARQLIHDAMGPASGIVSAFDLIADPLAASMREESIKLAADSARRLVAMLGLARLIHSEGAALTKGDLATAAGQVFDGSRAVFQLRFEGAEPTALSGRVLLGLLQIAATASAAGGEVNANHSGAGTFEISVECVGPRVRLADEVVAGFAGVRPDSGALHRWAPAFMIGAMARGSGGNVRAERSSVGAMFRAIIGPTAA